MKHLRGLVTLTLLAATATSLTGCAASQTPAEAASQAAQLQEALRTTVVYEVEGTTGSADITIETPTGSQQQDTVAVPVVNKLGATGLTYTFQGGDVVYLAAQNHEDAGTVTCRITSNGRVVSENTATGGYAIASCTGTA